MNRNTKIALAVVAAIVLLCLCVVIVAVLVGGSAMRQIGKSVSVDPQKLNAQAAEIVDLQGMPEALTPQFGMSLMGVNSVGYGVQDGSTFLMLMQFSPDVATDPQAMEQAIAQAFAQQTGGNGQQMELVEEIPVTIRGEETTLRVFEGETNGQAMRQATATFEGKGGPAILMVGALASEWDQALIDQILAAMQ